MPPRDPIRVLIADGDPLVCRALVRLLQDADEVDVVATATDGGAVLDRAGQFQPAVAVIDARTARLDGLAVTRSLCQQAPAISVVVLSVYATFHDAALAAGACRFLLKDCSRDELVAAIQRAAHGQCQAYGQDDPAPTAGRGLHEEQRTDPARSAWASERSSP